MLHEVVKDLERLDGGIFGVLRKTQLDGVHHRLNKLVEEALAQGEGREDKSVQESFSLICSFFLVQVFLRQGFYSVYHFLFDESEKKSARWRQCRYAHTRIGIL